MLYSWSFKKEFAFYGFYCLILFIILELIVIKDLNNLPNCNSKGRKIVLIVSKIHRVKKAFQFKQDIIINCPNIGKNCEFVNLDKGHECFKEANFVLFNAVFSELFPAIPYLARTKLPNQKYAIGLWEAPSHTHIGTIFPYHLNDLVQQFDFTMYFDRENADIWSREQNYDHFIPNKQRPRFNMTLVDEIINGKTRHMAAMISDCFDDWGRLEFLNDLRQYGVSVDIYGWCGEMGPCLTYGDDNCYSNLEKDYFFYASLENSICNGYVTEKIVRPLQHFLVPVAVGGIDYSNFTPPNSIVEVSKFENTKQLADFLIALTKNLNDEYKKYFQWKNDNWGISKFAASCEICQFLNGDRQFPTNMEPKKSLKNTKCWRGIYRQEKHQIDSYQDSGKRQIIRQLSGVWNDFQKQGFRIILRLFY